MGLLFVKCCLFCRVNVGAGVGTFDSSVNIAADDGSWVGFVNLGVDVESSLGLIACVSIIFLLFLGVLPIRIIHLLWGPQFVNLELWLKVDRSTLLLCHLPPVLRSLLFEPFGKR